MDRKKQLKETISIPEGISLVLGKKEIVIKGKAGEVSLALNYPNVSIVQDSGKIVIASSRATNRENKILKTWKAVIKNGLRGVVKPFILKLKVCSGHFPMTVSLKGKDFEVKNFFGEKIPRQLVLKDGAKVKVEGDIITVESPNKALASQVAADIESLTRRTGFDMRVFQDGIWIFEKDGEKI
ncbi:50S ribosomal protein L6 [Candidatus Woesearchaeota archaeon]|nr:50S ribosomal protein L6 [Candidatus Woesearchaeota archaeon]